MPSTNDLKITKVCTCEGLNNLRPYWQRLARLQEEANAFSTWEWNSCWWQVYGRKDSMYILVVQREDEIVGIAPFRLVRRPRNSPVALRQLRFIGDNADAGLLDILTVPGAREMVWRTIFVELASSRNWDILELGNLDAGATTRRVIAEEAKRQRWRENFHELPIIQIRLPRTWDEFLTGISAKLRRQLVLAERKLNEKYDVTYTQPKSAEEVAECLKQLFELHTRRWAQKGADGAFSAKRRALYHLVSNTAAQAGWLDLWELKVSGRSVAIEYGLHYRGCRYAMQSGFAPEFAHYNVGRLLEAFLIRTAIERGDQLYDFLFGVQRFKLRWGAEPRRASHIRIFRPWSFGSLAMQTARLVGKSLRYQTGRDSS